MPVKKMKSSLAARLGDEARQAVEERRSKGPEYDAQSGLPAGIEGGIAKLVDCKFTTIAEGKQNAGKDMFYAAGIIVSPSEHNGINLIGQRTQISEFLFHTPTRSRKTVGEHADWVVNELMKLGLEGEELDVEDLEGAAEALKEVGPYFRFRTWSGDKVEIINRGGKWFAGTKGPYLTEQAAKTANPFAGREPMVNHVWNGACDYVEDEADAVVDATEEVAKPKLKPGKKPVKKAAEPEPEEEDAGEEDLAELASLADGGDEDAALKLTELAKGAGIDEDSVGASESWADVVAMINGDAEEEEEEEEEDAEEEEEEEEKAAEDDWQPEKGEVYPYRAPGKRKAMDHEVTAVFEGKQTVNLKDLTTEKVYRGVAWDKLDR
jgi:hypothetical protein